MTRNTTVSKQQHQSYPQTLQPSLCGSLRMTSFTSASVFEIVLAYLEKRDWQEAFFTVLPQRKGAVPVGQEDKQELDKDEEEEDSDRDLDTCEPVTEKTDHLNDQQENASSLKEPNSCGLTVEQKAKTS